MLDFLKTWSLKPQPWSQISLRRKGGRHKTLCWIVSRHKTWRSIEVGISYDIKPLFVSSRHKTVVLSFWNTGLPSWEDKRKQRNISWCMKCHKKFVEKWKHTMLSFSTRSHCLFIYLSFLLVFYSLPLTLFFSPSLSPHFLSFCFIHISSFP